MSVNPLLFCCQKPRAVPKFDEQVGPRRLGLILSNGSKWANGTTIKYWFNTGPEDQKKMVRESFQHWVDVGIGLKFREVQERDTADLRIGFNYGAGSWSYVGIECYNITDKSQDTMNIGWPLQNQPDTAVHEIGHAIGFPHEHQNPNNGIVWNEDAVYRYFGAPPNSWDKDSTYHNVIRKLDASEILEATKWDVDSVMHYPFAAGLIKVPTIYQTQKLEPNHPGPSYLSDLDKKAVRTYYPPIASENNPLTGAAAAAAAAPASALEEFKSLPVTLEEGREADFTISPKKDEMIVVETIGPVDATLVLFQVDATGERTKIDAIVSVGKKFNESSQLIASVKGGEHYVVNVRLISKYRSGKMAVLYYCA